MPNPEKVAAPFRRRSTAFAGGLLMLLSLFREPLLLRTLFLLGRLDRLTKKNEEAEAAALSRTMAAKLTFAVIGIFRLEPNVAR